MTCTSPEPTAHDVEMARVRQEIADHQAEAYQQVLRWALGAFGPGWLPSHRHYLASKEAEEQHRATGQPIVPAAVVYTVKNADTGTRRHFTVGGDGSVKECASYEEGFGPMLLEPHPTRGFTDNNGVFHHTHRYSLCWADYPLYTPRSPEQLAALRVSRERGKAAREQAAYERDNPLLAWAERAQTEESTPER